jgi:hypothetical protein
MIQSISTITNGTLELATPDSLLFAALATTVFDFLL